MGSEVCGERRKGPPEGDIINIERQLWYLYDIPNCKNNTATIFWTRKSQKYLITNINRYLKSTRFENIKLLWILENSTDTKCAKCSFTTLFFFFLRRLRQTIQTCNYLEKLRGFLPLVNIEHKLWNSVWIFRYSAFCISATH